MKEMTMRMMRKMKKNDEMNEEARTDRTEEVRKMIRTKQEDRLKNEAGEV